MLHSFAKCLCVGISTGTALHVVGNIGICSPDIHIGKELNHTIPAAKAQVESALKGYQLVNKKYTQGQANLIEMTNARTQLTNAKQAVILAKYEYQLKMIGLERAVGKN